MSAARGRNGWSGAARRLGGPRWSWAALVLVFVGGCKGSTSFLGPGEPCTSSTQCQPGLLCDLGRDPPVCSMDLTEPPDASPPAPDAPAPVIDAGPVVDAMPGTPDAPPPPPPPDAALPDAPPPPLPDAAPPPPPDAALPDA